MKTKLDPSLKDFAVCVLGEERRLPHTWIVYVNQIDGHVPARIASRDFMSEDKARKYFDSMCRLADESASGEWAIQLIHITERSVWSMCDRLFDSSSEVQEYDYMMC